VHTFRRFCTQSRLLPLSEIVDRTIGETSPYHSLTRPTGPVLDKMGEQTAQACDNA